jgi:hypothetical protein
LQKNNEEGSFHYKNRRLKKGENTTRITRAFQTRFRAVALLICRFDVCAALHEKPADFNVTLFRRIMKRGPSTARTGDEKRAKTQQESRVHFKQGLGGVALMKFFCVDAGGVCSHVIAH